MHNLCDDLAERFADFLNLDEDVAREALPEIVRLIRTFKAGQPDLQIERRRVQVDLP